MSAKQVHPAVQRRIAAIVSGPHACPDCAGATWTSPPEPWPAMRQFVTECSACTRPLQVRVRPELVVRGARHDTAPSLDVVTDMLDTPGVRSFRRRLALAAVVPIVGCLLVAVVASWTVAILVAAVLVIPSAMWTPSVLAVGASRVRAHARTSRPASSAPRQGIEITRARWGQLDRERYIHRREQLDELQQVEHAAAG